MEIFIHWAGFVGAWLLVAGPLFQAAVELRDEGYDRDAFELAATDIPRPEPVSRWWWLLPPVAYILNSRRGNKQRQAIMKAIPQSQREQLVGFMNKANGWFFVAGGAFLIFLKEAWELTQLYEWPTFVYWIIVVALAIAAIANTVARLSQADGAIHADDPGYQERQRAQKAAAFADRKAQRKPVK